CRINAEDPARDFKPVAGVITRLRLPDGFGVRVDSALEEGGEILPAYDSMIAKLVATGRDRPEAIARMRRALGECVVEGVPTTIGFHRRVMSHPVFVGEGATTAFLTEHPEVIGTERMDADAAGSERTERSELVVEVDNRRFTVRMSAGLALNGSTQDLGAKTRALPARRTARSGGGGGGGGGRDLKSPIQGTVIRVAVEVGQVVGAGDLVCVIDAMEMENEVAAHRAGTVAAINVHPGEAVKIGTDLATIES
ncbi:MAG: biotin/lipoyl-containing protein, partial [Thermomicrobiales bacterium]